MKKRLFHSITSPERQSSLHRSHVAKSLVTGRPSRRMEAEISCLKKDGCEVRVHEVTSKGEVKNRLYILNDVNPSLHALLEKFAKEKNWKSLFAIVDFFREDK